MQERQSLRSAVLTRKEFQSETLPTFEFNESIFCFDENFAIESEDLPETCEVNEEINALVSSHYKNKVSSALKDMNSFMSKLPNIFLEPKMEKSDEANECYVEWSGRGKAIFLLFQGNGKYGYGLKSGKFFKEGSEEVPFASFIPNDMLKYLEKNFKK